MSSCQEVGRRDARCSNAVPVDRVVDVGTHPAVEMLCGFGDPVAALGHRVRRQRLQPPRRTGHLAGPVKPFRGTLVVVQPPVVNEPDVLQISPPLWHLADALLEQLDGQIRTPWSIRVRLGQENGTKAIGHVESRIEARGDVEQRVE